jgi:hypothetical protein
MAPGSQAIGIYAKRNSGSNPLYIDCFVLIPVDEFAIRVHMAQALGGTLYVQSNPLNQISGFTVYDTNYTREHTPPRAAGPGVPVGATYLYFVTADETLNTELGEQADITLAWYPRYRSLRGAG